MTSASDTTTAYVWLVRRTDSPLLEPPVSAVTQGLAHDRFASTEVSPPQSPPVVLVHGFTQNRSCWGNLPTRLASQNDVVVLDAPGHGESSDVRADLHAAGQLIGATTGRSSVVGYSMGGRMALHLALDQPDLVERLVLIGATAGIEDPVERGLRRSADDALADHLVEVGVPAFIDEWLAQPLFASLSPAAACRAQRLTNTAEGLASSLRLAGTGTQLPLWDRLPELRMPVLVVAGGTDTKFRSLGQRLVASIGDNAELAVIDGAGHCAHLEQPDAFAEVLLSWLS